MLTTASLDASPRRLLRGMRGTIEAASYGYPEVLLLSVRDAQGDLWRFMTEAVSYAPWTPEALVGRAVLDAEIDDAGTTRITLSGDDTLELVPWPLEDGEDDDVAYWELIAPDDVFLEFGPGISWLIGDARAPMRRQAAHR